jgi:hypothetical protein
MLISSEPVLFALPLIIADAADVTPLLGPNVTAPASLTVKVVVPELFSSDHTPAAYTVVPSAF